MSVMSFNTGISFPSMIIPSGQQPLDGRTIVESLPTTKSNFTTACYIGMTVVDKTDCKMYVLQQINGDALVWKEIGSGGGLSPEQLANLVTKDQIGTLLSFAGSMDSVLTLPTASEEYIGKTYNIRDQFKLEEPSYNADGSIALDKDGNLIMVSKKYPAGTNVVCYKFEYSKPTTDDQGNPTTKTVTSYRWDALGGVVDWDWEEVN